MTFSGAPMTNHFCLENSWMRVFHLQMDAWSYFIFIDIRSLIEVHVGFGAILVITDPIFASFCVLILFAS